MKKQPENKWKIKDKYCKIKHKTKYLIKYKEIKDVKVKHKYHKINKI